MVLKLYATQKIGKPVPDSFRGGFIFPPTHICVLFYSFFACRTGRLNSFVLYLTYEQEQRNNIYVKK